LTRTSLLRSANVTRAALYRKLILLGRKKEEGRRNKKYIIIF